MEIIRLDQQTVVIREINSFGAGLLRQIPLETDPGNDPTALNRVFSKPIEGGKGKQAKELNEEWTQYVEPELRHLFQSANITVSEDLKQIRQTPGNEGAEIYELHIPANHLEQWLITLNQARLVMAARNGFTDEELDSRYPALINSTRDMNLLQIDFYARIQEFLVREVQKN